MDMWLIWLIVIIFLAVIEIATINLVSVWFIASAIVCLFMSFFVESFYIQFIVFVVLGLILLVLTRPYLVKKLVKKDEKTNLDRIIGMEGLVTDQISKHHVGEIHVDGKKWSAISEEEILAGETVVVMAINGVKLVVRREEK